MSCFKTFSLACQRTAFSATRKMSTRPAPVANSNNWVALLRGQGDTSVLVNEYNTVSLVESHKEYLDKVKNHGEGSINLKVDGNLAHIQINNPKKKNAMSGKMMYDLAVCMDQLLSARAAGEQTIVGLMYRGSGKFFCSGADITLVKEVLNTPEMGVAMSDFMTDVITRLRTSGIISLCLLNGPALGGGAELCTGADFRIMADLGPDDTPSGPSNYVAFVHAKIGASPAWGGANRLYTIVGRAGALKMLGQSAKIGKAECIKMGLVDEIADFENLKKHTPCYNEVHTEDEFEKAFLKVGQDFLQPYLDMPFPGSVCAIKRCVAAVEYEVPEKACARTRALLATRWASADNKKALAGKKIYSTKK